ncbi:uncharacterized protein LOC131323471 isoform X2 [Rhododendron vialii]|uniref:uncharacterized protein LOC131323471 isoform X2 n=1 Tax=Rhododendron vialii TaxID=182163 RepID=UPI00265F5AB2|nr:uncharacterized protein LOC131323471 isoform X2 [Rhododendron vialii]
MEEEEEEAIGSSANPLLVFKSSSPSPTPAASSAWASSPAVPVNAGSIDWLDHGQGSKAGSLSRIGSQNLRTLLSTSAGGSDLGSSQPSCRPWERGDLLRRLSTFKPANWCGKPKAASSLNCARRGWVNFAVDKIECESCGANLQFVLSASWTPTEGAAEDFAKQLDAAHKVSCPWRGNSGAESLDSYFISSGHADLLTRRYEELGIEPEDFVGQDMYFGSFLKCCEFERTSFIDSIVRSRVTVTQDRDKVNVRAIVRCSWLAPPVDFVQLCTDAAYVKATGLGGGGGVLRDHTGRVLELFSLEFSGLLSVEEAEFRAFQYGLSFVAKYSFRRIVIASDCLKLVQALQGHLSVPEIDGAPRELDFASLEDYTVVHMPRDANEAAHILAKCGLDLHGLGALARESRKRYSFRQARQICRKDATNFAHFRVYFVDEEEARNGRSVKTCPASSSQVVHPRSSLVQQRNYHSRSGKVDSFSAGNDLSAESCRRGHEITVNMALLVNSDQGNNGLPPFTSFDATGLPSELLREVRHAGFSASTPIQVQSWPIALQDLDIVTVAKPGSGKTLGYLFPGSIHPSRWRNNPQMGPSVLVLSPTRELATQIQDEAVQFGKSSQISCTIGIITGGGYWYSWPTYPVQKTPILSSMKNSCYSPSWDVQVNKQMKTMEQGLPKFLSREKLAYIAMLIKRGFRRASFL